MRRSLLILVVPSLLAAQQPTQQGGQSVNRSSKEVRDAARSRTRPPWEPIDNDATPVPFVISASGGISLGAYQAGVTWALGRLTRLLADDRGVRERMALGTPKLWGTTGASAGNINAVLSTIEWCAASPPTPEQSLFWKVWINVGWPELFPARRTGTSSDTGLFDRGYFKRMLYPAIDARMSSTPVIAGCDSLPIGITATRIDPAYFQVTGQLVAQTQRFASVFQVERGSGDTIRFRQADPGLRSRSLGEMFALALTDGNRLGDSVFKLIEASSSFPIAFSPRGISYYDADQLRHNGTCQAPADSLRRRCADPEFAFFTDGGVFDNNPLQLAIDMYERRAPGLRVFPDSDSSRVILSLPKIAPRVLFVGVDNFRGELATKQLIVTPAPVGGLQAVIRLIQGAVPAARQYEMQTLARSIADSQRVPPTYIRASTRYFPVFGDFLYAFGSFLGRPLREWDFYAGLYDAMHFAAQDVICTPRAGKAYDAKEAADVCVKDYVDQLISGSVVPLDRIAPIVLRDMYAIEFKDSTKRAPPDSFPPGVTPDEVLRLKSLRALTRVQRAQRERIIAARGVPPNCSNPDWADQLLCLGYLDKVLAAIKADPSALSAYRAMSADDRCTTYKESLEKPCLADVAFVRLIDDPAADVKDRVDQVFYRMWQVETTYEHVRDSVKKHSKNGDGRDSTGRLMYAPAHDGLVEFAEMLFRSVDWPARHGRDLDPSSIPPHDHGWLKYSTSLLPYYGGVNMYIGGFDVGWQPQYHLGNRWMLQAPTSFTSVHGFYEYRDTVGATFLRGGFGLGRKWPGLMLNSVGASVRPTIAAFRFRTDPGANWAQLPWKEVSFEANAELLATKARVSLFWLGHGLVYRGDHKKRLGGSVSLTDVPGIVYWLKR